MRILCFFSVVFLLAGCSRYYYQPNSVNAPMLTEKNDVNVVVNGTWGDDEVNGSRANNHVVNVQAAYSPVDYVGVIGGYSGYRYKIQNDPDPGSGRVDASASLLEIGVGGYYPVYRIREGMTLIADAYAGFGGGSLKSDINLDVNRLFVQPGFSLRTPFADLGLHGRFSAMKFSNLDPKGMPESYLQERNLTDIDNERTFFFEPALTLRGGYKFIKFQFQHVWSNPMKDIAWNHSDNITTIGLYFSVDDLMRFRDGR